MATDESAITTTENDIDLNVKYCMLREDLPIQAQLFETLMVKETKSVISLFDLDPSDPQSTNSNKRSKQSNRRRRRKEQKQQQRMLEMKHQSQQATDGSSSEGPPSRSSSQSRLDLNEIHKQMMELSPSQNLDAHEWNDHLRQAQTTGDALLLDVRNVYESRVGHFSAPGVGTLLTNTRKYSDLPHLLATSKNVQEKQKIFMYCTGGVRCERVSMLVQTLYPEKEVYQLQGGIQTYLRTVQDTRNCVIDEPNEDSNDGDESKRVQKQNCEEDSLFRGKNFVFDPRRTDPVHFGKIIGKCLVCHTPHDDYDNGHAPSENKEARCNTCRMLVLVCDNCRPNYRCWGEDEDADKPILYCGNTRCSHEGAAPQPELVLPPE